MEHDNTYNQIQTITNKFEALVTQPQALIELKKKNPLLLKKALEGLSRLHAEPLYEEDYYLTCAKSGIDLLSIIDGQRNVIHSHGQCIQCGLTFSTDHLHTNSESTMEWPVVYKGYYCKECYANPTD